MATKAEMQAEIDRLTEKVERAEQVMDGLRQHMNSPKFRGTDPRDGQTNGRVAVEDITGWLVQGQGFIDEVDSFPWGLALRVTDRRIYCGFGGRGVDAFAMNERDFGDLMWSQKNLWRSRRNDAA